MNNTKKYRQNTSLLKNKKAKERKLQTNLAETFNCYDMPILSSVNNLTENVYDQRISRLLELFDSLSSHDVIHNEASPQYKAACYLLYDDVKEMNVEDELTMERYISYLFLISTERLMWGEALPSNICDVEGINCDINDHIIELDFCKYFMANTFDLF